MQKKKIFILLPYLIIPVGSLFLQGCDISGYSNSWPYPSEYQTVYVEMFDTSGFRRGHEVILTDSICKHLESQTPYTIVSDRDRADTLLSGNLIMGSAVLTGERYTGRPLEQEARATVDFIWKDLKTGQEIVKDQVTASATYSSFMRQSFDYSSSLAVNKAAEKVVERLENKW